MFSMLIVESLRSGFAAKYLSAVIESMQRGANYEDIISTIPIKRWGHPKEIAEAIVFLASEKASLVNGTELVVDGGKCYAP